uniref:Uncharacterized protein n=1 Tax=Glossina pallidipes TaxID=7398 RepID=A0A1B0A1L6_GLOPL
MYIHPRQMQFSHSRLWMEIDRHLETIVVWEIVQKLSYLPHPPPHFSLMVVDGCDFPEEEEEEEEEKEFAYMNFDLAKA